MSWQRMCYYKYNRAIISITELHYMLVPWRAGKECVIFRSHSVSNVSDEWLQNAFLCLETARLAFKQVTQQWTEVYDLLSLITTVTLIAAPGYNASRVQARSLAFNRLCTSAHGVDDSPPSWAQAWNCKLASRCNLHLMLLTQIYYWALLFCK